MNPVGFQTEPAAREASPYPDLRAARWLDSRNEPALEGVMLGLRLRGFLTDHERGILDWLFGPQQIAFLVKDGLFLHPDGVPILPEGALDVPPLESPEATYTQNLRVPYHSDNGHHLLRAARLSLSSESVLIIGAIGRDDFPNRGDDDYRFGRLVHRCREAWQRAGRIARALEARVDDRTPHMIISRASGRIITACPCMAGRLGCRVDELAGREYSQIAGRMTRVTFRLDNTEIEDTPLTIASLPAPKDKVSPDTRRFVSDFFVHSMRNKLASITAGSTHLGDLADRKGQSDMAELAGIIASESLELSRHVDRLESLVSDHDRGGVEVSIADELNRAVELLAAGAEIKPSITITGDRCTRTVRAPLSGLVLLFDAVLRTHRLPDIATGAVTIDVRESDQATAIIFTVEGASDGNITLSARWRGYVERLADRLGILWSHQSPGASTIEIPIDGETNIHD